MGDAGETERRRPWTGKVKACPNSLSSWPTFLPFARPKKLVAKAVHLECELRGAHDWRLSAKAWVDTCLANGDSNMEKLSALKLKIQEKAEVYPNVGAYVRRLAQAIGGGNYRAPPKDSSVMWGACAGFDEARDEVHDLDGYSMWLLWALAAERAGERCLAKTLIGEPVSLALWI